MAEARVGFIGIGTMGVRMANRLLDAGHALVIYDTNAAAMEPLLRRGATGVSSAAAVASAAQTVFASLPTPWIVQAVALGENGVIEARA